MTESNKDEYLNKIRGIISNRRLVSSSLDKTQKEIAEAKESNELVTAKFQRVESLFVCIPKNSFTNPDPHFGSFIGSAGSIINSEYEFSKKLSEQASNFSSNTLFLSGTTASTTTAEVLTDVSAIYYQTQNRRPEFNKMRATFVIEKPIEKKERISDKLFQISPKLRDMFNSAWQSFFDESKDRGVIYPAHAMRELLSDFLQELDKNNKVKEMDWCEFSENKQPTQKSRVRFAILGVNNLSEENIFFKPIIELMDKARELYLKLNGYAHFRKESLPLNYKIDIEIYLATLQDIIESIINMRAKFYKNDD